MKKTWVLGILLLVGLCLIFLACPRPPGDLIINDFETDTDLDRLFWRCRTLYSLSPVHGSHGAACLKLELFPAPYPGVSFLDYPEDWSVYGALALDIFNPEDNGGVVRITLRIDDKENTPPYEDRFNHSFRLEPGANQLSIPLSSLKTPRGRPLDFAHIKAFMLFAVDPPVQKTLFLDHVRLVSQQHP